MSTETTSFYCLGDCEWSKIMLTFALKKYKIQSILDCRPQTQSKNRVFNKKALRRILPGVKYEYNKRLAGADNVTPALLSGSLAGLKRPALIITAPGDTQARPYEVCNALLDSEESVEILLVNGSKVSNEPFQRAVVSLSVSDTKKESKKRKQVSPLRKNVLTIKRFNAETESGLPPSEDIIHSCGLIVTRKAGDDLEMLVINRSRQWELAKGRVEKRETFAETAIRELREETGCENPEELQVDWKQSFVTEYQTRRKKQVMTKFVFWFHARLPDGRDLRFGKREAKTHTVEWIPIYTEVKNMNVSEALKMLNVLASEPDPVLPEEEILSAPEPKQKDKRKKGPVKSETGIVFQSPPRFSMDKPELYTAYLKEHGFVVIANVLSEKEIAEGKELFWKWMEGLNAGIDPNDTNTWIDANWPAAQRFKTGILHTFGIGQSDFMWYLRTRPQVRNAYEHVWNSRELLTSFDGCAAWRPWREWSEWKTTETWFHVDQDPCINSGLECVQGQVTLMDANEETGGFACIPGSHKEFHKFADIMKNPSPRQLRLADNKLKQENVQSLQKIMVRSLAGDMILWDSRTMHASTHAVQEPEEKAQGLIRLTGFICIGPKLPTTSQDVLNKRLAAVNAYQTSGHQHFKMLATPDEDEANAYRARKGLKMLKVSKRNKELPAEAYSLIMGYDPLNEKL